MGDAAETLARRFDVMRPHLSEFQRRLWLGAEAAELGLGGVAIVAEATGVAADTVRRGRAEAAGTQVPAPGRSRRPGGGRKRAEARDSELTAALEALVDPVTRGDPMSPLRWTCKSTRTLAQALTGAGHPVSDFVVRRLLRQLGYSLQANAKVSEGSSQHPDRDAQFAYLNDQAATHLAAGDPVISVDAKKKENIGEFRNGGREWQPKGSPEPVNVHDFIDKELGKVTRYRDLRRCGQRRVGLGGHRPRHRRVRRDDHRPLVAGRRPARLPGRGPAADLRRRRRVQRLPHPAVEDRARRPRRQHRPGHHRLPPPARHSKWNKIEHRLFSHISMNWRTAGP